MLVSYSVWVTVWINGMINFKFTVLCNIWTGWQTTNFEFWISDEALTKMRRIWAHNECRTVICYLVGGVALCKPVYKLQSSATPKTLKIKIDCKVYYNNPEEKLKDNRLCTNRKCIKIEKCVRQGYVSSPDLFNLYSYSERLRSSISIHYWWSQS